MEEIEAREVRRVAIVYQTSSEPALLDKMAAAQLNAAMKRGGPLRVNKFWNPIWEKKEISCKFLGIIGPSFPVITRGKEQNNRYHPVESSRFESISLPEI